MKRIIVVLALLSVGIVGCGKGHVAKQVAKQAPSVNAETFTLNEADTMLAQPSDAANQQVASASNIVVNNEAGPLAETVPAAAQAPEASSQTPDGKLIQQALKNLGLYSGTIDGRIGHKTKEAIKDFQRKNNLSADGKVGPKTWAILKKALEQAAPAAPASVVKK